MARELQTLLLATTNAVETVQTLTVWKSIKLAKDVLEFIGKCPEWINYNKKLEEHLQLLGRKMEHLESVQADVKTQLENTEIQSGKKRKREVEHWLNSVKKKAVEVKLVENDISSVRYLPRFLFRAWLGCCVGKEIQQVTELQGQGKFTEGLLLDAPRDHGEPLVTNVLVGEAVLEKIDQIWSHLINPRITKIGVHGSEGIGKSAIMAEVYNRLCSYNRVYYVHVPKDFSVYRLQAAIAAEMKVNLPQTEGSEMRRASRLYAVLKSMKEYTLILDGLSNDFFLEDVGIPMVSNVGKLVITSRFADVCRRMSCQETVVLQAIPREDGEKLFMEKLAAVAPLSEQIREVARDIVQRCEGVPFRIINMAIMLRGVSDINEWRNTLEDM